VKTALLFPLKNNLFYKYKWNKIIKSCLVFLFIGLCTTTCKKNENNSEAQLDNNKIEEDYYIIKNTKFEPIVEFDNSIFPLQVFAMAMYERKENKNIESNFYRVNVNPDEGLRVRDIPDLQGNKIYLLPNKSLVEVIKTDDKSVNIDGINSNWKQIKYNNITGWVFGGYLQKENSEDDIIQRLGEIHENLGCKIHISVESNYTPVIPVTIEIEGEPFIRKSTINKTVNPNEDIEIYPQIIYNYSNLRKLVQPTIENVTFRLFVDNQLLSEINKTVDFRSLNEVPFALYLRGNPKEKIDYSYLFAAMVNEDDPFIDQILKEALENGIINVYSGKKSQHNSFIGDQGTSDDVLNQVFAIWNVFQRHGIKYSSIANTSSFSKIVSSQYVRDFKDSFNNKQANCVDGSVLFASILTKIDIDSILLIFPNHMMVAFYAGDNNYYFIETTLIGKKDINTYENINEISRNEFLDALISGVREYRKYKNHFDDDKNSDYKIISISEERKKGLRPVHIVYNF